MNYRKKANITLALVAIGFVIASVLLHFFVDNTFAKMVFYVLEAALIGGMADWFAVTAIFKKPLGFPFHTAIIPRNRKTIVNSIVNIVEKEFLSADLIAARLEKIQITPKLVSWLDSESGREYMKTAAIGFLKKLDDKDFEKVSTFLNEQISANTKDVDFNKYIHSFMEESIRNGSYKKILSVLLEDIIKVAEGPEIRNKILAAIENVKEEKTKGFFGALFDVALSETNLVNIQEIADSIHMHLIETLYNLKKQDNEDAAFLLGAIEEHLLLNGFRGIEPEVVDTLKEQIVSGVVKASLIKSMVNELIQELEHPTMLLDGDRLQQVEGSYEKIDDNDAAAVPISDIKQGAQFEAEGVKAAGVTKVIEAMDAVKAAGFAETIEANEANEAMEAVEGVDTAGVTKTIEAMEAEEGVEATEVVEPIEAIKAKETKETIEAAKNAEVAITMAVRKEVSLFAVLLNHVEKTWNNMKADEEFVGYIEKNLKETIHILIEREHSVIGKIARDTLDSFSDDALNHFIEDRAGNDLQWIRINGSIVGAMVGILVFLFLEFFYDPIAVPFIRSLFLG